MHLHVPVVQERSPDARVTAEDLTGEAEVSSAQRRRRHNHVLPRPSPAKSSKRSLRLRSLYACGDFSKLPLEVSVQVEF